MRAKTLARLLSPMAVAGGLVVLLQLAADAQARMSLSACTKAFSRGAVYGSELATRECGNRFTTQDPYVALVIHLENVLEGQTVVAIQLFDPEQTSVWAWRPTITVEPGYRATYWIWGVLAVAADREALAREDRRLVDQLIEVRGKPVRERLGEWIFQVGLGRGTPQTLKFRLEAAPGSLTPAPTPPPAPAATPTPSQ
ncbi:MAG: hypothetical protein QN131_07060 [Armatimonadota bacterium]|nr:hypothetical protein [Armatimonadota bacterium]